MASPGDKVTDALLHSVLDTLFGHGIAERIGGFAGNVVAHLIAGLLLTTFLGAIGWFAWFELPGRIRARAIRRAKTGHLNILIARFDGDGARDIKDRIREQLDSVFGDVFDRPFEIFHLPVTMRDFEAGMESANVARIERKGRRWMKRSNANLLIWGRAHDIPNQARISFLFEETPTKIVSTQVSRQTGTVQTSVPYGTRIYNFATSPEQFGSDAARAVGYAALTCVSPLYSVGNISTLTSERGLELIRRLEPFIAGHSQGIPENLRSDIRTVYILASAGLGRAGLAEGWRRAFSTLEANLVSLNKVETSLAWRQAAGALVAVKREAGERFGDCALLDDALSLSREALGVCTPQDDLLEWVQWQQAIGDILAILGDREIGTTQLDEAIAAYESALRQCPKQESPRDWAQLKARLGFALYRRAVRNIDVNDASAAISHLREAIEASFLDGDLPEAINAKSGLAAALVDNWIKSEGGQLASDTDYDKAIAILNECSRVARREEFPETWATVQWRLGIALARRESDIDEVYDAIDTLELAQTVITRERAPIRWAVIGAEKAGATQFIGEHEIGTSSLLRAVECFDEVTRTISRESAPYYWANAQCSLGGALLRLYEHGHNVDHLSRATEACELALDEFKLEAMPQRHIHVLDYLGPIYLAVAQNGKDAEMFDRAVRAFRTALTGEARGTVKNNRKVNLANALLSRGRAFSELPTLTEAEQLYREVLPAFPQDERLRGFLHYNFGIALTVLCELGEGTERLEESIIMFGLALEEFRICGDERMERVTKELLEGAKSALPTESWRKR